MSEQLNQVIQWIHQHKPTRIVALTGAGISAESGIPTFRGPAGLWRDFRPEDLATPEAFHRDPVTVWEWYEWRRDLIRSAIPNVAHLALAELEKIARIDFAIITQNVDGLHARAGSNRILELHGNIFRVRCTRDNQVTETPEPFPQLPPRCRCAALLRPDVVWFGEALPHEVFDESVDLVREADLVFVIGTSGTVYPAAGLVSLLQHGRSVEINPDVTPLSSGCDYPIRASAIQAVPPLVAALKAAFA